MGYFVSNVPIIISPIFVMKKYIEGQSQKPKINYDNSKYKEQKIKTFRAPDYVFQKNDNLSVCNFKDEDAFT